jgi:hypothetical protein
MCVVIVLLNCRIDDMKSINSQNNDQHELWCLDWLLEFLRDPVTPYDLFHRMMKFQCAPTFIACDKSLKSTLLVGVEDV